MNLAQLLILLLTYYPCTVLGTEEKTENKDAHEKKEDPLKFNSQDVGHIKEHLKEQYGFDNEKAEKYLKEFDSQTQFFVMHDYDKNSKLDGLELLKSMTHFHEHEDEKDEKEDHHEKEEDTSETLVQFVDMILKDQDYNKDGYIDYPEYISYYSKFEDEEKDK